MKKIIKKAEDISLVMKNFANRDKLAIMCFLGKKQKNVSEIMECSELSQPQISRYLGMMKIEGILESQKIGKEVFYEIKDKKILEIIKALKNIYL